MAIKRKIKYGKSLVVIFLTVLIWVWADLAKTETYSLSNATVYFAKSMSPSLLTTFRNQQASVSIEEIVLKGAASKIADAKRKSNLGLLELNFFLDITREAKITAGEYPVDVAQFLKKTDQIKKLGLTVESCRPQKIYVDVIELVKKFLKVQCIDEQGNLLNIKSVEPVSVEMFVEKSWSGERLIAWIQLNEGEIDQAKHSVIGKKPFIKLAGGQIRRAVRTVNVTMSPQQIGRLNDETISTPILGFVLSPALQGKYKVIVSNLNDVIGAAISIKSTPAAKQAYSGQKYQMLLYVWDQDKNSTKEISREVEYNFPEDFVREGEIQLNPPATIARFKLEALTEPSE